MAAFERGAAHAQIGAAGRGAHVDLADRRIGIGVVGLDIDAPTEMRAGRDGHARIDRERRAIGKIGPQIAGKRQRIRRHQAMPAERRWRRAGRPGDAVRRGVEGIGADDEPLAGIGPAGMIEARAAKAAGKLRVIDAIGGAGNDAGIAADHHQHVEAGRIGDRLPIVGRAGQRFLRPRRRGRIAAIGVVVIAAGVASDHAELLDGAAGPDDEAPVLARGRRVRLGPIDRVGRRKDRVVVADRDQKAAIGRPADRVERDAGRRAASAPSN